MRVSKSKGGYYRIDDVTPSALRTIKTLVPAVYRIEGDGCWFVKEKYVELVMASSASTQPDTGFTSDGLRVERAYATLFLTKDAPATVVRAVWKALASEHHPDKGGDVKRFNEIREAYEVLSGYLSRDS